MTLRRPARLTRRDDGSVLTMTLVLILVSSLVISSLLTFIGTMVRTQPVLEQRNRAVESARSALRMAVLMQVSDGAASCLDPSRLPAGVFDSNSFQTTVTCRIAELSETGRGRYAVITTQNDPTRRALSGFSGVPSGTTSFKDIDGDVFVDGGDLLAGTQDILVKGSAVRPARVEYSDSGATAPGAIGLPARVLERYRVGGELAVACDAAAMSADGFAQTVSAIDRTSYTHVHPVCSQASFPSSSGIAWWQRAGDDLHPEDDDPTWVYPRLPQIPTFDRDGKYVNLTSTCRMYYPGRYENPLVLDGAGGREHYFASGVYYFSSPISVTGGAQVVFGEGRTAGCAVDSDLALHPESLTNHSISGKGATILLDRGATLRVTNSGLTINRRISTPSTRASEGVAVRTVNFGTNTAVLQVPRDVVQQGEYPCKLAAPDTCAEPFEPDIANPAGTVDVAAHEVTLPGVPAPISVRYAGSTLDPTSDAITVDFSGTTSATISRFEADGYLFVPNAGVTLKTPPSGPQRRNYRFVATAGIVASHVALDAPLLPTDPAMNWFAGVQSQTSHLTVELGVRVANSRGTQAVARATVEVNANGAYAINGWSVEGSDSAGEIDVGDSAAMRVPPDDLASISPELRVMGSMPMLQQRRRPTTRSARGKRRAGAGRSR